MSVMQVQESMDSSADLQVWNNAAFDNEDLTGSRQSWGSLKSIFANPKASFDSVSDKENHGVLQENQVSSVKSEDKPFKPVNRDGAMEKSRIVRKGMEENVKESRDEKKIDEEIEEIESQIVKLSSRLEALRIEKAERSVKVVEKRGRVVPAKFKEIKIAEDKKIVEEVSNLSAKTKVLRRGISLGPAEIIAGGRRGMSMGPSEIFGGVKSKQLGKQEMITPVQSRRKSCYWKLQDIDEDKVFDKRFKSTGVSPNSRKAAAKTSIASRQAVTTIASRKTLKKEDVVIKPKNLFKEGEKSVNKKPVRPGRVVASRYNNQNSTQASAMRKRSLPENDDSKRVDKKRSLSAGKSRVNESESKNVGTESRVKKRWEIPSEIIVHGSLEGEKVSPRSIVAVPELLPRLRIARRTNESPRDSGPAKKVAELIGRKSFFSHDEEVEPSVCQALTYAEEEYDEESL